MASEPGKTKEEDKKTTSDESPGKGIKPLSLPQITPEKESAVIQRLLQDPQLGVKIKDYIKKIVAGTTADVSPQKTSSGGLQDSPDSKKPKAYTEAEVKKMLEEAVIREKKKYEDEKAIMVTKFEAINKKKTELQTELKKKEDYIKNLNDVSNPVSTFFIL